MSADLYDCRGCGEPHRWGEHTRTAEGHSVVCSAVDTSPARCDDCGGWHGNVCPVVGPSACDCDAAAFLARRGTFAPGYSEMNRPDTEGDDDR